MKILHITATRTGSTGCTATNLKEYLLSKGNQYKIAFSVKDYKSLDSDILIGNKLDRKFHAFCSRLFGLQGYFSYFATKRLLKEVDFYGPDLVQLGNLHANYINLPLLFDYLHRKCIPVVMILHDCWFFTGKCTHFTARRCDKWKTECNHCPAIRNDNESWFLDKTRKMFKDRMHWYRSLRSLTVIAVSDWEKSLAEQSPLFKNANIIRVYNWIDTDAFAPKTKEEIDVVCNRYGLNTDVRYVISVSAVWSLSSSKTKDAIAFASQLPQGYKLIIVGGGDADLFPESVIRIPHIADVGELAALYSLVSAYLHFSVEDTFGKVIAEAMACGTVPIVFDSTACGETAGPYGIVVKPHDILAMIAAIPMAEDVSRRQAVRKYVVDNYDWPVNIEYYWGDFNEKN